MENKAKNIKDILSNDNYIIPRYQRNYAWGKTEISQLIKDIHEFFTKEDHDKSYYLGSLVCFKRENGSFELIDGQQRHTTLTLINLVLKNWKEKIENTVSESNLKFDSRKKIQNYIENLYSFSGESITFLTKANEINTLGTGSFKDAIEIIQEELREKDVKYFANNFLENVYMFHVEVPEDTDLNHYFEIMNNRGEQLEKHEIVKALLMGKICDLKEQEKFATIWDACADMNDYVYFNFKKADRQSLFDNNGKLKAENYDNISVSENEDNRQELSLADIIGNHNIINDFPKEAKFIKDKYKSIIDFPNFLLQVLKIKNDIVSLDDKKLLEQFENIKPDPKEFIFELLKYRVLFDKYLIKQDLSDSDESKQNWGIGNLNADFETTIKTFKNDEELTKLQVMLYYSDSTNTYNNWLHEIMKNTEFEVDLYAKKVLTIAKDKFQKDNLLYPSISIFNFYFIDFLLWKLYAQNIKGKEAFKDDNSDILNNLKKKIFNQSKLFKSFKFRQLNSKEHLAAQSNPSSANIKPEELNGIGNLCLISSSQNSAGNKESPNDKKKRFSSDNSSLKRLIMFESFENEKWQEKQIQEHKSEILELINS
jgi:hypothetical protein